MKGFAVVSKGIEQIVADELKELVVSKCSVSEYTVQFETKKMEDFLFLCYKSQSVDRIVYSLGEFTFKDFFPEFEKFISKLKLESWMKAKKFRMECIRYGNHTFNSADVEGKSMKLISSKFKMKFERNEFDIIFFVYVVNDKCLFGIDLSGFELNKRNYKIYTHASSIRGTIGYALVRLSDFKPKDALLDAFSRDGIIPIEAGFYATGFPINYFRKDKFAFRRLKLGIDFDKFFAKIDKKFNKKVTKIFSYDHMFKYVDFAKKNAKIAGIDKQLNFSRVEVEWLDIKFTKECVDRIVTYLPSSKSKNLDKIYKEFFYQCEFILKKKGKLVILARLPNLVKKYAENNKFIVCEEVSIYSGEQKLDILILKKK